MIDSTVFLSAFLGSTTAGFLVSIAAAWKAKKKYRETVKSHPMFGGAKQ